MKPAFTERQWRILASLVPGEEPHFEPGEACLIDLVKRGMVQPFFPRLSSCEWAVMRSFKVITTKRIELLEAAGLPVADLKLQLLEIERWLEEIQELADDDYRLDAEMELRADAEAEYEEEDDD